MTPPDGVAFTNGLIATSEGVAIGNHSLNDTGRQVFVPLSTDDPPFAVGSGIHRASFCAKDGKLTSPKPDDPGGAIMVLVTSRNVGEPGKPAIPFTRHGTIRVHHPLKIPAGSGIRCLARGQSTDEMRTGDHKVKIVSDTKLIMMPLGSHMSIMPAGTGRFWHILNADGHPILQEGRDDQLAHREAKRGIIPETEEPLGVGGAVVV